MKFDLSTYIIIAIVAMSILRRTAGATVQWRKLYKRYPSKRQPTGRTVRAANMAIGTANFGPFVSCRVSPRGLCFEQPALLGLLMPPIMVPWTHVSVLRYIREPLLRGYEVALGSPEQEEEPIIAKLPDKVIQSARMFIQVPEAELPESRFERK